MVSQNYETKAISHQVRSRHIAVELGMFTVPFLVYIRQEENSTYLAK